MKSIALEFGVGLLELIKSHEEIIYKRIKQLRNQISQKYLVQLPLVNVIDNPNLESQQFIIKINGEVCFQNQIVNTCLLNNKTNEETMNLYPIFDVVYELPDKWTIQEEKCFQQAITLKSIKPIEFLIVHLENAINLHSHLLITEAFVQKLAIKNEEIAMLLEKKQLTSSVLTKVFQNLVKEGIPINQSDFIFINFLEVWNNTTRKSNADFLTAFIRSQMSDVLLRLYAQKDGKIHSFSFCDSVYNDFEVFENSDEIDLKMSKTKIKPFLQKVIINAIVLVNDNKLPILLIQNPFHRIGIAKIVMSLGLPIIVLARNELPDNVDYQIYNKITSFH
jgi:flagellar biosynthesis protein FlhA